MTEEHELVDCYDMFSEDTRVEGWIENEIESGTVLCVDPEHGKTSLFKDTQEGDFHSYIELELCENYSERENIVCKTHEET